MKKIIYFVLFSLLVTFFCLTINGTYSLFTKKIDKTGSISTIKSEATFLEGRQFNGKIKILAGNSNATYETVDSNVINISRSDTLLINPTSDNIISDSNSIMPIYAWFSNGTLYYYSEANTLYSHDSAYCMFCLFNNLESIDIEEINTSRTSNMQSIFNSSYKLQNLDLSNFDTSNVVNMQAMFMNNTLVKSLDLTNFNTSKVTNMHAMFNNCSNLETLDISSFDMSKVTNTTLMLYNLTNIREIKTPSIYPNDTSVQLGFSKTLYDENMVGYTSLGKSTTPTSPTQTWLKEGYTVSFDSNGGKNTNNNVLFNFDGSTQTINGTNNGATWGANYLEFNGTSSWVDLGEINSDYLTINAEFSIDEDHTSGDQDVLGSWHTGGGGIYINSSKKVCGSLYISNSYTILCTSNNYSLNTKYNVTLSYDGSIVKLFVNGELIRKVEIEGTIKQPTNNTHMILGADPNGSSAVANYLSGKIYSASIYENERYTKIVRKDSQYGNLPIPVRDGYTFLGWNGKNLIDVNNLTNNLLYDDGTPHSNDAWVLSDYISVEEGDYIFSYSNTANNTYDQFKYATYDENKQFIEKDAFSGWSRNYSKIISISSNVKYIRLSYSINVSGNDVTRENVQFEKGNVVTEYEPYYVLSSTDVTKEENHTLTARWELNNYTISFDKGNLLYGMEPNQSLVENANMDYSITNGVIEVTSKVDDGCGYTTGRFNLEANKTYIFNASTDGVWGGGNTDTVDAFLMLDGTYPGTYYHMNSNIDYEFTPTTTGEYWLRLDVNQANKTYHFWNISIKEKTIETKQVTYNSLYGTLPTPTRQYYSFVGWNTSEDGTGSYVTNNSLVTITGNQTLYAQWNPLLTLNENINYFNVTNDTLTGFSGSTNYCLQFGSFRLDNIQLNDELIFEADIEYTNLTSSVSDYSMIFQLYGNVTMWNAAGYNGPRFIISGTGTKRYIYRFKLNASRSKENDFYRIQLRTDNYNGGTLKLTSVKVKKVDSTSIEYNSTYGTLPTLTRTGYTFLGWNTKEDGTGTNITSSTNVTSKNPQMLYAKWQANTYTITYDKNYFDDDLFGRKSINLDSYSNNGGVTNKELIDEPSAKYGKKIKFTMSNYNDRINSNGPYIIYAPEVGEEYSYSFYVRTNRNISMSLGHNSGGIIGVDVTTNWQRVTGTFTATSGGNALRWYNSNMKFQDGDWIEIHSVEFRKADSLNIIESTKSYDSTLGTLPSPTREGYTLDGWYTDPLSGTAITSDTLVEGNITYYAHWTPISSTLTFNPNNGTVSPVSKTVTYDFVYGELPIPTRTNYGFLGWNLASNGTGAYITENSVVDKYQAHAVYAIWQDNTSLVAGKTWNFDYTGSVQKFIAPVAGTYKLETWGAQGGGNASLKCEDGVTPCSIGGYGGYSTGEIELSDDTLFLQVGSKGVDKRNVFNGGSYGAPGGGGATSITTTNRGQLASYNNFRSEIIIVSGGGGGDDAIGRGGSGGGFKGGDSSYLRTDVQPTQDKLATGGTQSAGGTGYENGTFGKGGGFDTYALDHSDLGGAGGGGYYGGGAGGNPSWSSGGGGSGYIGNSLLTNKSMYCYNCEESLNNTTNEEKNIFTVSTIGISQYIDSANCPDGYSSSATSKCAKEGHGYARITLVSID